MSMDRRQFVRRASGLFMAASPALLRPESAAAQMLRGGRPAPSSATSLIPLSKADSRFASNTAGLQQNYTTGTLTNKSWDESTSYPDGGSAFSLTPGSGQSFTISQCIIDWREGPRLAATGGGIFNIDQCYINCVGKTGDHADGIQAFVSGGATGVLNITNSCIQTYTTAQAIAKYGAGFIEGSCFQWADAYQGQINLTNVCLMSGQNYTVNVGADVGVTANSWQDVYVVDNAGLRFENNGGTNTFPVWSNVRNATIVGNSIVPGTSIPQPTP